MRVGFVLTMTGAVVDGREIDQLTIEWSDDLNQTEIFKLSHEWITGENFLTSRMIGLTRVGESSLTIEPLEDAPIY